MRLGVLLQRRSHIKTLASVIDAGVARGHEVTLVLSPIAAKKGDRLSFREVELLWGRETRIESSYAGLDALVALEACMPIDFKGRMVSVDAFFDCWLTSPLLRRGAMAYTSEFHREQHMLLWRSVGGDMRLLREWEDTHVVGWLQADQAQWIEPGPRDSAVFFTLKMDPRLGEPWRQSADGRAFYRDVYEQARAQAKAEGLRFVVKSRAKNRDPWWVWWYADDYYEDVQMLPYTSMQLLARAKWCVHFESGAALEAALMGCYGYVVKVPQGHVDKLPGAEHIYWTKPDPPAMHSWVGVTRYGLPEVTRDVDPAGRQAYLEHFLGPCDGKAGQRVIEICES